MKKKLMLSSEFCDLFRDVFQFPENMTSFCITGEVGGIVSMECEVYLLVNEGEVSKVATEIKRYEIVEK